MKIEAVQRLKASEAKPSGYDRESNKLRVAALLDGLDRNPTPLRQAWNKRMAEAATRLSSMTIKQGDNFADSKKMVKDIMERNLSEFKVLDTESYTVLTRNQGMSVWYVLVDLKSSAPDKPLKKLGSLIGFMGVLRFPTGDEVYSVFVDPAYQGKGIGKQIYEIAHKNCKKYLASSEDMGTMSFGLWLSLYKKYEKIQFVVNQKKIPRKEISVDGLNVTWINKGKKINLVGDELPKFNLRWPK